MKTATAKKPKTNGNAAGSTTERSYQTIPISQIVPSDSEPQQRRRAKLIDEEIQELADSIKANGLIQPITVRPKKNGLSAFDPRQAVSIYEIVCGERRYLACQKAGLDSIDAVVRDLTDVQVLEIQGVENLQRKDVDPLDEAYYYKCLLETGKYSVHDLSIKLGRSEKNIRQKLRLNDLIPEVLQFVSNETLPLGHALEIAKYSPETQKEIHEEEWYFDYDERVMPLSEFKERLRDEISLILSKAAFDIADGTLHPEGLACGNCSQRTGFEPLLFEDELKNGDSCLNKACFESKTLVHLTRQRDAVAADIRIRKQIPIEKPVDVPLVTDGWYHSFEGPVFKKGEKILEQQKFLDKAECDHASPALIVKGERKGQQTFICTKPTTCKKHKPKESKTSPASREPSQWELQDQERKFQRDVANAVRRKILVESAGLFTERAFWSDSDLLTDIAAAVYNSRYYYAKDAIATWDPKAPEEGHSNRGKVREYIAGLDTAKLTQMLFILVYGEVGYTNYNVADHAPLQEINDRYAKLNYKLLDAETRVELAPKEFQPKAKMYLKAVQSGEEMDPPHFWWEEKKKEAA